MATQQQQIPDDTSSMSDEVFEPPEETERRKQGLCKDECYYFDPNKSQPNNIISPTSEFYTTNENTIQFGWGAKENTNDFCDDCDDDYNGQEKEDKEKETEEINDDWKSYPYEDNQVVEDTIPRKVILLGDSGVGKTSLLVKYNTGMFKPASFAATVGVALMVSLLN
ncbi:uncharacterized protein LOC129614597 [Condylostylus longicornis]|uniref:uncharacterized protein LOC129614597 n=1 Tax=Condylostylus longicornis TaxID=2530218 RepID=UPI00244DAEC6|nr:uncharacterized protein LOC129614597 [Condylostylus longicornis]